MVGTNNTQYDKWSNQANSDFDVKKSQVRTAVEAFLTNAFAEYPDTEVCRAAKYAVLGGGHRWRPIVAVAAGEIFRDDALEVSLPGACGAELAHSASLVLDDLPSMDDADIRRGKACTHNVFPDWAIDMTPVFLIRTYKPHPLDVVRDNRLCQKVGYVELGVFREEQTAVKGRGPLTWICQPNRRLGRDGWKH